MFQMEAPQRRFLELTLAGEKPKKLYMPGEAVLSYEEVPKDKNPTFPNGGVFLRYDFGEGLAFALVQESLEQVQEQVGEEGFIELALLDDAKLRLREHLIVAMQEREDEGIEATSVSITINGQVGSLLVKDTYEEIKAKKCS
jgi:hypothetical protein